MRVAPWKKTPDGYETTANGEKVTLSKKGKAWAVTIGGKAYDLKVKKPSFGHAEGIIQEHFKKQATGYSYDRRAAKPWPGYDRIRGRLSGPAPAGFVVMKATEGPSGFGRFGEDDVGADYVGDKAHQGSVLYLRKGGGGFQRWMDADDISQAVHEGVIKPYGVWTRR